jgi:para-nitrobenzyl esterase
MATPMAKGLFHRAILESAWNPPAGAMTGASLKDMEAIGEKLFAKLGVDKEADPVAAARALPVQKILETNRELCLEEKAMIGIWDETVDGWLLPDNPVNILKSGKYNIVPFIAGGNLGELTNGRFVLPNMIPLYLEMFSGAAKANVNAYAYIFNRVSEGRKKGGTTAAPHGMELYYIFGDYDNTSGWWTMPMPGQPNTDTPDPELNKTDIKVSEAMMTMWARFAKTGNPNAKKKADWPAYEAAADRYLYITETQEVKTGFSKIKKE